MWNKTSCAFSKSAKDSVNSAAQNNSASSASVPVKQRRRHADHAGTRCNGSEKAHEPLKNTGSAAESTVINKMTTTRTTGIAKILRYNRCSLRALRTTQRATHLLFDLCSTVEKQQVRSGQSELKILVSVVRFRPRPPVIKPYGTGKPCYIKNSRVSLFLLFYFQPCSRQTGPGGLPLALRLSEGLGGTRDTAERLAERRLR